MERQLISFPILHSLPLAFICRFIFSFPYLYVCVYNIYISSLYVYIYIYMGFPKGSVNKKSACNAGDLGLIPGSGRSSGGGNGNPLQFSCLKIPWREEPGGLQSKGLERVRHDWARTHMCIYILWFSEFSFKLLVTFYWILQLMS